MSDQILRRFEIVRNGVGPRGKELVAHYRPTELGARQAANSFQALERDHPDAGYQLRTVVSIPVEIQDSTPPAELTASAPDPADPSFNKFRQIADEVPDVDGQ